MWLSGRQQSQRSLGLDADVEGGADGAPEEVAVGERRPAAASPGCRWSGSGSGGRPCRARRAAAGRPRSGSARPASSRSTAGSLGGEHRRPLGLGQPRAQRQQRPPRASSARGAARPARGAGACVSAAIAAAPHAVGGEPARDPGRLRLELGVGHLGAVGDQRGAVGTALRSLGEPVVELHVGSLKWPGYRCRIMPETPQGRPARGGALRADRVASASGDYEDIRYETRRRDREDHDRPARGPQRLPAADADRAPRRVRAGARRPRGRRDHLHRRRRPRPSAPAATSGSAATTATSATTRSPSRASAGFHVGDLHVQIRRLPKPVVAMVAGYAVGGGHILHLVCDLTIAADNAVFGQTGPRVGSFDGGFGASLLARNVGDQEGEGDLVPLPPLRRRGGAARWGWSTPSCRSATSSARPSPGAARCSPSPPLACACSRRASTPHEDGLAGIQQLSHDATLLFYMTEEGQEGRNAYQQGRSPDFSKYPEAALMRIWLMAARPRTLPAAIAPVLVGTAAAVERHGDLPRVGRLHRRPGRLDLHPDRDQPRQRLLGRQARRRHRRPARARCGSPSAGPGRPAAGAGRDLDRLRGRGRRGDLPGDGRRAG